MNGLEAQHSHSEATQICEIPEEFQQSTPLPPLPQPQRELFLNNPLEALPKCAPHPPVTIHILSINSQVATVSKTTSAIARSRRLKTGCYELIAPVSKLGTNEADHKKNVPMMSTVGTQTFEPLVLSLASVESTSTAQPEKSTLEPPFPGRLPDHSSYRSLLDALLITPIIKPPLLESTRPSRKSTSVLEMQRKWRVLRDEGGLTQAMWEDGMLQCGAKPQLPQPSLALQYPSMPPTNAEDAIAPITQRLSNLEPTQFATCTAAAVRNVPENPENGASRPISAASGTGFKPSGPQYAEKTSGWESSKQSVELHELYDAST
ncbi:hypothetical protein Chor_001154 [Crotalus horridus]